MSDTVPTITISGKEYPVHPLVGRQLKFITPALFRWRKLMGDISLMQPENYDDLYTIIYHGAIRLADKTLTPEKLLDLPNVTLNDLVKAVGVITEATGLFRPLKEGDTSTGEATTDGQTSTGT